MATILDVARKAGVSKSTVSRVLNNYPLVSEETRSAVHAAMEELGYQFSGRGKSAFSRGKTILVISLGTVPSVMRGISRAASDNGYGVLQSLIWQEGEIPSHMKDLDGGLVAGVILLNINLPGELLADIARRFLVVQCNEFSRIPDVDLVSIDNLAAAYDITNHLIATGKKRLAFISVQGVKGHTVKFIADREYGFKKALDEAGLELNPGRVLRLEPTGKGDTPEAYVAEMMEAIRSQLLGLPAGERPDAIVCANDTAAACCINAAHEAGLRVPEDIAVTAFDNSLACLLAAPRLTTVNQPHDEMGYESVKLLVSKLDDGHSVPRQILLKHGIIVRGSSVKE